MKSLVGPLTALHILGEPIGLKACKLLAEKLELEGDHGLGEFVQSCMKEVNRELLAINAEARASKLRAAVNQTKEDQP